MKTYEIARPAVQRLAEETGELGNLLVEEHGRGSYLYRARGADAVEVEAHVGTGNPAEVRPTSWTAPPDHVDHRERPLQIYLCNVPKRTSLPHRRMQN